MQYFMHIQFEQNHKKYVRMEVPDDFNDFAVRIYHERTETGDPFATVCVIKTTDGSYYRGISFCSPEDQFVKKTGKFLALGRAVAAIKKDRGFTQVPDHVLFAAQRMDKALKDQVLESLGPYPEFTVWKAKANVKLTDFEKKLFENSVK